MDRSLKWRTIALIGLIRVCVGILLPSVTDDESRPSWFPFKRTINLQAAQAELKKELQRMRELRVRMLEAIEQHPTLSQLAATAVLAGLITIGGWSLRKGGGGMGIVCAIYALLYAFFAFLVARWNRGILPVAAALSMILAIFCAVGAESWFNRDRAGFDEALLPSALLGTLVILLGLLQIVLVAAALYAFNQEWHVEEERPIGSGEDYGAGASPQPA